MLTIYMYKENPVLISIAKSLIFPRTDEMTEKKEERGRY